MALQLATLAALAVCSAASDNAPPPALRGLQTPYYQTLQLYETIVDSIYSIPGSPPYTTYHYFTYTHATPSQPFRIRLSNLAQGLDVDMFVGDFSKPVPSASSFTYSSTNAYAEILDITPAASMPSYTYYVSFPAHAACTPKQGLTYPAPPPPLPPP